MYELEEENTVETIRMNSNQQINTSMNSNNNTSMNSTNSSIISNNTESNKLQNIKRIQEKYRLKIQHINNPQKPAIFTESEQENYAYNRSNAYKKNVQEQYEKSMKNLEKEHQERCEKLRVIQKKITTEQVSLLNVIEKQEEICTNLEKLSNDNHSLLEKIKTSIEIHWVQYSQFKKNIFIASISTVIGGLIITQKFGFLNFSLLREFFFPKDIVVKPEFLQSLLNGMKNLNGNNMINEQVIESLKTVSSIGVGLLLAWGRRIPVNIFKIKI